MTLHLWLAYLVAAIAIALSPGPGAVLAMSHGLSWGVRAASVTILGLQAGLGVLTLIHAVPVTLGVLHQAVAALVLATATVNLWLVRRSRPRMFASGLR